MVGLQGIGKIIVLVKLVLYLRKENWSVLLVVIDVYRLVVIDQLVILGKQIDVFVFELGIDIDFVEIVQKGLEKVKVDGIDIVIIDIVGWLQID